MADRRYSDRDVSLILRRAVELQQTDPGAAVGGDGLTLAQLEEVAREAGIDPALVRRAATELATRPVPEERSAFLGAPSRITIERRLAGTLREADYGTALAEIQRTLGQVGQPMAMGASFGWSSAHNMANSNMREVTVAITRRGGETRLLIEEKLGPLAGGLFGGLMGGIGGASLGLGLGVAWGVFGSALGGVLVPAAMIGGSYALARSVYGSSVRRRQRELAQLAERLAELVTAEEAPTSPAAPVPPGHR